MAEIATTARAQSAPINMDTIAANVQMLPPTVVHWNDHGTLAKITPRLDLRGGSSGSGPGAGNYVRDLDSKVGQLWPRLKKTLQEVDMGYIFRGDAVPQSVAGTATHTPLSVNLTAGDSGAFSGSGTTEITYTGPSVSLLLSGQVRWDTNGSGARRIALWQNGSEVVFERANPDATSSFTQSVTWPVVANSGDTFSLVVLQNSGGPINVTAGGLRGVVVGEWQ